MLFPRYLPLGSDSRPRRELVSLRHALDTTSPLVVHALRTGAMSEDQVRLFFCLQRDITGLLREVVKNEKSSGWQVKHHRAVKTAIKLGLAQLNAVQLDLFSIPTATQPRVQNPRMQKYHLDDPFVFTRPSSVVNNIRLNYMLRSRSGSGSGSSYERY